jgi:hypothetical protein
VWTSSLLSGNGPVMTLTDDEFHVSCNASNDNSDTITYEGKLSTEEKDEGEEEEEETAACLNDTQTLTIEM